MTHVVGMDARVLVRLAGNCLERFGEPHDQRRDIAIPVITRHEPFDLHKKLRRETIKPLPVTTRAERRRGIVRILITPSAAITTLPHDHQLMLLPANCANCIPLLVAQCSLHYNRPSKSSLSERVPESHHAT